MFIQKIKDFLQDYDNLSKDDFLEILKKSKWNFLVNHKLEKDFLLTVILVKIGQTYPDLIFKWWTCLNKVYFPYFRLSEDLDFVLNQDLWRSARQTILKQYETNLKADLQVLGLKLRDERTKSDEHKLAMFTFEYESILDSSIQTVKIDISLKHTLKLPPITGNIQSLYKDPILEELIFGDHTIQCIDLRESVAEKLRASLTRTEPAIRDFFDIWYIKTNSNLDFANSEFLQILDTKLAEVDYKYTILDQFDFLAKQVKTDLNPVLHTKSDFDLKGMYNFVLSFIEK